MTFPSSWQFFQVNTVVDERLSFSKRFFRNGNDSSNLICVSNLIIVFPSYVSKLTFTSNIGWILTVIKTIIHIWLRLPLVTKVINQQQATNHKVDMSHIDESSVDFSIALLYYQYRSFCIVFHGSPENHMGPFLYGFIWHGFHFRLTNQMPDYSW